MPIFDPKPNKSPQEREKRGENEARGVLGGEILCMKFLSKEGITASLNRR